MILPTKALLDNTTLCSFQPQGASLMVNQVFRTCQMFQVLDIGFNASHEFHDMGLSPLVDPNFGDCGEY
jgi:hypothetical protein